MEVLALSFLSFLYYTTITFAFIYLHRYLQERDEWKTYLPQVIEETQTIRIRFTKNVFGQWRWFLIFSNASNITIWEKEFKYYLNLNQALIWWDRKGLPLQQLTIIQTNEKDGD